MGIEDNVASLMKVKRTWTHSLRNAGSCPAAVVGFGGRPLKGLDAMSYELQRDRCSVGMSVGFLEYVMSVTSKKATHCIGTNLSVSLSGLACSFCRPEKAIMQMTGAVYGQCTFPSSIWGTWIRERDGSNFTISSSSFQGFNYYSGTQFYNDFRCQSINGATYVIVQDLPRAYTVDNQFVYLCFSIEVFGANSFLMTDLANISSKISVSDVDLTLVKGFVDIDPTLTELDVCAFQPAEVRSTIMYRSGKGDTAGEMAVTCPSIIHGNYNYTLDGTKCTGNSSFAVCPGRTTVVLDYGQCADQVAYSTSGILECMGSVTRGANTYLWTWIGSGTFSSTTIRTVCFALESSSGTVLASYTPQDCLVNQVASSVSPGGLLSMVPLELCPIITSEEQESNIAAVAGGATVGVLLLVAIAIVVIVLVMKKRNKKLSAVQADGTKTTGPSKTPASNGKTPTNGHVKHVTIAAPTVVTTVNENSTSSKKAANAGDTSPEKSKESPSKVQDNPINESKPTEPTSSPPSDPTAAASTTATTSGTPAATSSPSATPAASTAAAPSVASVTAATTPTPAAAAPTAAAPTAAASTAAAAADNKAAVTAAPKTDPTPPSVNTSAAPTTSATVALTAAPTVKPTPATPAAATAAAAAGAPTVAASSGRPDKSKQAHTATTEVKPSQGDSSKAQEDKEEKTKKKKKKKKKDKKKSE
ncbi:uncharacterized protein [Haliotis asinina]|uniref:uncharacterized protein n=1 Tax=Haliotis asinina TaxID=109174 RepID=UPI003531A48C